jgi:long-subunit fatty acid transport protein
MHRKNRILVTLGLTLAAVLTGAAFAQTDDDANGAVQFNFSTPGARSLAMGGAFLGSVDDATAAYSNPAGLLQLSEAEVSVEGRRWNYSTPFASHGRFSGRVSGIGADTVSGVQLGAADAELDGVSFAAFVLPRKKWAFAVYYHQAAKFQADFTTGGIFAGEGASERRLFPVRSSYDLDISQLGLALAAKWGDVAVGLAVSNFSFQLDSLTQRYVSGTSFYSPIDFSQAIPVNFQSQTGDSEELGFSVGLRWDLGPKTSVGAVYRSGPEFDLGVRSVGGSPNQPGQTFDDTTTNFNLPNVYGVGISYRPREPFTVNIDVARVTYSNLIEKFYVIFENNASVEDFVIDDVTEVHLGFEYVMAKGPIPIAFRFGGWLDPDHRLRAEGGASELTQARLFAGDDEVHYSAGIGLIITSHFQIDAAADFSEVADTVAVSAVYRF